MESQGRDSVTNPAWRRALWIALVLNLAMFVVELAAGLQADSVSLLADAVDFAGDAANYGLSLAVLGMAVVWRSRAALVKGLSMTAYGLFVIGKAAWVLHSGTVPEPLTMGVVGAIALVVNTGVAVLLYTFRTGDANMRSVWLCSRNDALSNLAVMLAALGVFGTGSAWPDLVVAGVMAALALSAGVTVVREARRELAAVPA
ncbi:cation transporter [Hydrogenophaga sp. H7]|nr:cation transporter [Hydrogenophaga sp. H7]